LITFKSGKLLNGKNMKISASQIGKYRLKGQPVVMLTSYDYPTALIEDRCGVDVQLVGDSVGTNVLGYSDVSQVTISDMIHHTAAVARGAGTSFVLCDMPFGSFANPEMAVENAGKLISAGADGIKMEGEQESLEQVRAVAGIGIPVCAHIGYTPQTDGAKASVQGKNLERALELINIAKELETAGAFMIVLELIPWQLSAEITRLLSIPTIGIGAGPYCTGQVQVIHDIIGLSGRIYKHAKAFTDTAKTVSMAVQEYASQVISGDFPSVANAASLSEDILEQLKKQTGLGFERK
jgi:3-methyl-2-oxobutanoate hydroxymethyltransferase